MEKSIIIIGAGISGLSAGCYAQMNGYKSEIYELHNLPGGLCTSWQRKGYTFDGCIHWLIGSNPKSSANNLWREVGIAENTKFINHEEYLRVKDTNGKEVIIYTDPDKLESHLLSLSPEDEKPIKELCSAIRKCKHFLPPVSNSFGEYMKMIPNILPVISVIDKYSHLSLEKFSEQFQSPLISDALKLTFKVPDIPMLTVVMALGNFFNKNAGYPIGGSLKFAKCIEQHYLNLGGNIHYNSRVSEIIVENDHAVGVRLEDGKEHRADIVISAADGYSTIFKMLNGKFIDENIKGHYDNSPIFSPLIQVSIGADYDLSDKPHALSVKLKEPINIAGEERKWLNIKHYCFDKSLSPNKKSSVVVNWKSDYDFWNKMRNDTAAYQFNKDDISKKTIELIEQEYKGFKDKIEIVDVATPLTYERYTANWKGSMEGWLVTTDNIDSIRVIGGAMSKTLPRLSNFYMVGQWVEPGGGVPTALISARNCIKLLCKKEKKKFLTNNL